MLREAPSAPEPQDDSPTAFPATGLKQQHMRRFSGETLLVPSMGDVVDLVELMDANKVKNAAVKAGREVQP